MARTQRQDLDEALVRDHLAGSVTAFERLVERHAPGVAAAIERLVGDHHLALDLAQEVFIKLHARLPHYRFEGRFRALLYAAALNRARDALRERKRSRLVFLEETGAHETGALVHDPGPDRERRVRIEAALERVPEPFREAVFLRDVVGLSYDELAASLDCEPGTAKSRVNRGRLAFRDHYLGRARAENGKTGGEPHVS